MSYIAIDIICEEEYIDTVSNLLIEHGAMGTSEDNNKFEAFFDDDQFSVEDIESILAVINSDFSLEYKLKALEDTNWNQLWESNYDPILVDEFCFIHAPFHNKNKSVKHNILINPKMAFGTGHHETTFLMMKAIQELSLKDKDVLDLGSGSGILAILAKKEEAKHVVAIDYDNNAYENMVENSIINEEETIQNQLGTINEVDGKFDFILANITKNYLIEDALKIVNKLKQGGKLILSGFYTKDATEVKQTYEKLHLTYIKTFEKNNWNAVIFNK